MRWLLIGLAFAVMTFLVVVPLVNVFYEAFAKGAGVYWDNLFEDDRDTRHAILLTLIVAPVAVVLNMVFGVAAAWAIARFRFPGRTLLTALIDLPFAVSPVVAGLMLRAAVRPAGLLRTVAARARHQDHLRLAGPGAGDDAS